MIRGGLIFIAWVGTFVQMESGLTDLIKWAFDGAGGAFVLLVLDRYLDRRQRSKEETAQPAEQVAPVSGRFAKVWLALIALCLATGMVSTSVYVWRVRGNNAKRYTTTGNVKSEISVPLERLTPPNNKTTHDQKRAGARGPSPVGRPPENSRDFSPKRVTEAERITAIIAHQLQVTQQSIKPEDDLERDLGADPLDKKELLMNLETEYNINISDEDAKSLHTVGQIIAYIQRREGNQ
jgi:acyl carrier protein